MRNRNIMSPLLLALMSGALLGMAQVAAAQAVASPYTNVDSSYARVVIQPRIMLSQGEQDRLQAHADRGISALRQYLWRTRMIYNYYMPDILNMP
jgi:hypothetical protein